LFGGILEERTEYRDREARGDGIPCCGKPLCPRTGVGHLCAWLGLQRLEDIAAMRQVMSEVTQKTVSGAMESG
jgi:hypothetical protein